MSARWELAEAHLFLSINNTVHGLAAGGLRIAESATAADADDLAHRMTLKLAAGRVPLGGAKAVVVPKTGTPRAEVLAAAGRALAPLLQQHYLVGEDLGTTGADVLELYRNANVDPIQVVVERAAARGVTIQVPPGLGLADLMDPAFAGALAGRGVATALRTALHHNAESPDGLRVAVQGFGSVGRAAVRAAHELGARVVTVADIAGAVHHPQGLDPDVLEAIVDEFGSVDRRRLPHDVQLADASSWTSYPADVLIPAAVSDTLRSDNLAAVPAEVRYVVEGANGPVTPQAAEMLEHRGTVVIPDFVANAGSALTFGLLASGESTVETVEQDYLERISETIRDSAEHRESVRTRAYARAAEFLTTLS